MAYGLAEAKYFEEFNLAGQRKPMVTIPTYSRPISEDEEILFIQMVSPDSVTLNNIIEKYIYARQILRQHCNK